MNVYYADAFVSSVLTVMLDTANKLASSINLFCCIIYFMIT